MTEFEEKLDPGQYGARRGRSTTMALIDNYGAQITFSIHKRAEKSKIAISNRRCGPVRACAQEMYIYF